VGRELSVDHAGFSLHERLAQLPIFWLASSKAGIFFGKSFASMSPNGLGRHIWVENQIPSWHEATRVLTGLFGSVAAGHE
jgi:hypothetical protein